MADSQIWSWVLTAIGLAGFFLAGRKVWWCWYVNIANQVIWALYSILTAQWGFLVGVAAYTVIFSQNAFSWTREHMYLNIIERRSAEYDKPFNDDGWVHDGLKKEVTWYDRDY